MLPLMASASVGPFSRKPRRQQQARRAVGCLFDSRGCGRLRLHVERGEACCRRCARKCATTLRRCPSRTGHWCRRCGRNAWRPRCERHRKIDRLDARLGDGFLRHVERARARVEAHQLSSHVVSARWHIYPVGAVSVGGGRRFHRVTGAHHNRHTGQGNRCCHCPSADAARSRRHALLDPAVDRRRCQNGRRPAGEQNNRQSRARIASADAPLPYRDDAAGMPSVRMQW